MSDSKKIDYSYTRQAENGKKTIKDSYQIDRRTKEHILVSRDVKINPPPKG